MLLAWPAALVALAALLPLAAIYLLRRQASVRPVSSLLLWDRLASRSPSGRRVDRFRAPLSLLLEAIAITALALAAAGPLLTSAGTAPPVFVILDDSLSMRATDGRSSARDRALARLRAELPAGAPVIPILAGAEPRLLPSAEPASLDRALAAWSASATEADLPAAIALARDLAGPSARVCVLTDRSPDEPDSLAAGLRWIAAGRPLANAAITGAVRGRDEALVAVANFASQPSTLTLVAGEGAPQTLELAAGQSAQVRFPIPASAEPLEIALRGGDALAADDHVILAPPIERTVRVRLDIESPPLAGALRAALAAASGAVVVAKGETLLMTDAPPAATAAAAVHRLVFHRPSDGGDLAAYTGAFLLDRDRPVAEALDLTGVVWAAPAEIDLPGDPLLFGRSAPLITEQGRTLHVALAPEATNLFRLPAWPVLIASVVERAAESLPGPAVANLPVGERLELTAPDGEPVAHTSPGSETTTLDPVRGRVAVALEEPGVHVFTVSDRTSLVSALALAPAESDLQDRNAAAIGRLAEPDDEQPGSRPLAWLAALLALAALVPHALLTLAARRSA